MRWKLLYNFTGIIIVNLKYEITEYSIILWYQIQWSVEVRWSFKYIKTETVSKGCERNLHLILLKFYQMMTRKYLYVIVQDFTRFGKISGRIWLSQNTHGETKQALIFLQGRV